MRAERILHIPTPDPMHSPALAFFLGIGRGGLGRSGGVGGVLVGHQFVGEMPSVLRPWIAL